MNSGSGSGSSSCRRTPRARQASPNRMSPPAALGDGEIVRPGVQPVEGLADAGGGEAFLVGRKTRLGAIRGVDHVAGEEKNLPWRLAGIPMTQDFVGQRPGRGAQGKGRRFVGEHLDVLRVAGLAGDFDACRPSFTRVADMSARAAGGRAGTVRIAADWRGDKNIQAHAGLSVGVSVIRAEAGNA